MHWLLVLMLTSSAGEDAKQTKRFASLDACTLALAQVIEHQSQLPGRIVGIGCSQDRVKKIRKL